MRGEGDLRKAERRRMHTMVSAEEGASGRDMRDRLAIAKMKQECASWEEVRRSWFSSMFCVTGATDALAREILGKDSIDAMYAVHNQKVAMTNPYVS
jgi:hypothetical protein